MTSYDHEFTPGAGQIVAINMDRIAKNMELLGRARCKELFEVLERRLTHIVDAVSRLPQGREELILLIHQSQGSSGSLGLNGLMASLSDFEGKVASFVGRCAEDRRALSHDAQSMHCSIRSAVARLFAEPTARSSC